VVGVVDALPGVEAWSLHSLGCLVVSTRVLVNAFGYCLVLIVEAVLVNLTGSWLTDRTRLLDFTSETSENIRARARKSRKIFVVDAKT